MNGSEFQIVCIFKCNYESFLINKKTLVKHLFYFHFLEVKYEVHRIIDITKIILYSFVAQTRNNIIHIYNTSATNTPLNYIVG